MIHRKKTGRKENKRKRAIWATRICLICFIIFAALFVKEAFLQPYLAQKAARNTKALYHDVSITPAITSTAGTASGYGTGISLTPAPCDTRQILSSFQKLLGQNSDTKGWLTYPGTNIDYVVMQNSTDPQYYLTHDFFKQDQKAGCLFLDQKASIETDTRNLVIHGHNMKSTNSMFHQLERLKKLDYFKEHTLFHFNTLYKTGEWKVFSVFITNGSDKKEAFFDYTQSVFKNSTKYLNFIYQLRLRSIYNLDQVDINEDDQLCTLSTCSYEINDYRLVIVARRVREGEAASMDSGLITRNSEPLYPQSYYANYGGKAPIWPDTFRQAYKKGLIAWYKTPS